jgi:hypothetical protein
MNSLPDEDRPPVFKSWSAWYAIVVALLIAQIIAFYMITW